jgi:cytoskeletal protein CcmA (bactofilin family)
MPLITNLKSFFNSLKNTNDSNSRDKLMCRSMPSIISKNLNIEGTLQSSGVIEIEGQINGNISINSIVIRESGIVNGDVTTRSINIRGNFNGNIKTKNINISSKAKINGNIEYQSLSVEDGASIDAQFIQLSKAD